MELFQVPVAEKLLKAGEVAKMLEISLSLVYRLMRTGEIPAIRMSSHTVRVRASDLEAYIDRCRAGGISG